MNRALCLAALGAAFLTGCNKSPEGGTPGTDNSFTFNLPPNTPATTIKQKEKKTVTVELNRGKDFKHPVKFEAKVPDGSGLKAEFEKSTVGPADPTKVNLMIEASDKATVGEHKVMVTGTPEQGQAATKEFTVKVENP